VQEVNQLLAQFKQMQKMMKGGGKGIRSMMGKDFPVWVIGRVTRTCHLSLSLVLSGWSMATRIRLRRVGRKGLALYRIVIADKEAPRDGRFIETIGTYQPKADKNPVTVDAEKARAWMAKALRRRRRSLRS
jgi:small subunit ribosomal protein S16